MLVSKNQIDLELIKGRVNQSFTWLSKSHSPFQRSDCPSSCIQILLCLEGVFDKGVS